MGLALTILENRWICDSSSSMAVWASVCRFLFLPLIPSVDILLFLFLPFLSPPSPAPSSLFPFYFPLSPSFPSPGDLPNPGIEPRSPTLQADSLPAEPQENPKNTRVGSLSLLQQIFPTQESNWGLLYCRWILYQLSYQGNTGLTYHTADVERSEPASELASEIINASKMVFLGNRSL